MSSSSLIGGLAAEAHGAGWTTFDADIVIATSEDNFVRLAAALTDLEAMAMKVLAAKRSIMRAIELARAVLTGGTHAREEGLG